MSATQLASNDSKRIGILAGWGDYPIEVARALKRAGHQVYCAGIAGHANSELKELCDVYQQVGVAKMGAHIRFFRKNGVREATMAGKVFKTELFRRFAWLVHAPDLICLRYFYHNFVSGKKDCRDDSLLGTYTAAYADYGITLAPATDFAPELLVKPGSIGRTQLSNAQWQDVCFGWAIAKDMGRLDVGQSIIVAKRTVVAVEAVEGTDECIKRAGQLCAAGGFTLVKVAKPQQDMRFDVPTIGLRTLKTLYDAGGRAIAIEADKTILLNQQDVIEFANKHKMAIIALQDAEMQQLRKAA